MRIESLVCPQHIEEKLQSKHGVTVYEVRQVFWSKPRIRFAEKGHTEGNDVYAAFGQTFGGRYLSVFFIYKPDSRTAIVLSARNMSNKERRRYGRK